MHAGDSFHSYRTIVSSRRGPLPTLVAGLVVAPLKHITMPRTPAMALFGLTVNGAWGLGTAIIFRLTARQK